MDVRIDHFCFNGTHWATKTEAEFIEDCMTTGNYPAQLEGNSARSWLSGAYKLIILTCGNNKGGEAPATPPFLKN